MENNKIMNLSKAIDSLCSILFQTRTLYLSLILLAQNVSTIAFWGPCCYWESHKTNNYNYYRTVLFRSLHSGRSINWLPQTFLSVNFPQISGIKCYALFEHEAEECGEGILKSMIEDIRILPSAASKEDLEGTISPETFDLVKFGTDQTIGTCAVFESKPGIGELMLELIAVNSVEDAEVVLSLPARQALYLLLLARAQNLGLQRVEINAKNAIIPAELLLSLGFEETCQGTFSMLCEQSSQPPSFPLSISFSDGTLAMDQNLEMNLPKGDEMVDWVNEYGIPLCSIPRSVVHQLNILHRGVGILVKNNQGEIYVHQRTASKRIFPSMYDMFVGGVSLTGELAAFSARREIQEELGIGHIDSQLSPLFKCVVTTSYNRCFVNVFEYCCQPEEQITWQKEEVSWGNFVCEEHIESKMIQKDKPFVPDGLIVWEDYKSFRDVTREVKNIKSCTTE